MKKKYRFHIILLFIISGFLMFYVFIRAYSLSFTHDESLSFTIVMGDKTWAYTANNHLLNTLLMKVSGLFFGTSEISLRLPNVISLIFYLLAIFLIVRRIQNNSLLVSWFCLMALNPFLIEFFSLARGYGLTVSFVMMSLYMLIEMIRSDSQSENHFRFTAGSILFALLAVYSNLSCINYLISLLFLICINLITNRNRFSTTRYWVIILISLVPLSLEIKHLIALRKMNQLYFGSDSFFEGITSLLTSSISPVFNADGLAPGILFFLICFLIAGISIVLYHKNYRSHLFYLTCLIVLILSSLFIENYIFGAKFPQERTALFYIPILSVFIYFVFINMMELFKNFSKYLKLMCYAGSFIVVINFFLDANFSYSKVWRYDAHTKDAMNRVKERTIHDKEYKSISNHWLFEPTINYYIHLWKLRMTPANRDGINTNSDFIYRIDEKEVLPNFKTIFSYQDINSELLMKSAQ